MEPNPPSLHYSNQESQGLGRVTGYLERVGELVGEVREADVLRLADSLEEVWRKGGKLLLMGNGGSAATASHFANDFQKCLQVETGRALRAICLADCGPLVLAWANDSDYANIFAPQVECWAEPGDLVVGISGSGNSPNVIRGIEAAKLKGASTFGLSGFGGGRLSIVADDRIVVKSDNMQQIEDLHTIILHAAFTELRERVRNG